MKSTIKTAAWICAILLVSVSCYDDGTDCFDTATRISLYPDVELFNADGTTASGNESFVSAVTVNVGPAVSDMAWEASVPASAVWATVRRTTVASIFEEAAGGARHDLSADGIELVLQPNTEYRRTVVVTIAAADGTTADYEFTQLGQKADAAVTSETAQLVFMAAGGSETVIYTSNMGDAYAYEVVYGEGSADWLTVGDGGVGTLTLTASQWDDQERPRAATLRIVAPTRCRWKCAPSAARHWACAGSPLMPVPVASAPCVSVWPARSWTPSTATATLAKSVRIPTRWQRPTRRLLITDINLCLNF